MGSELVLALGKQSFVFWLGHPGLLFSAAGLTVYVFVPWGPGLHKFRAAPPRSSNLAFLLLSRKGGVGGLVPEPQRGTKVANHDLTVGLAGGREWTGAKGNLSARGLTGGSHYKGRGKNERVPIRQYNKPMREVWNV